MEVTKAITVRQPWAACIAEGFKQVENRGHNVTYRGPIAIHAGRLADVEAVSDERVMEVRGRLVRLGRRIRHSSVRGAVIAVAALADCHRATAYGGGTMHGTVCCRPWGDREYGLGPARHLVLRDIRCLPEPVYVRGQQSVPWTLPPDVAERVVAQLGEVA